MKEHERFPWCWKLPKEKGFILGGVDFLSALCHLPHKTQIKGKEGNEQQGSDLFAQIDTQKGAAACAKYRARRFGCAINCAISNVF